MKAEKSTGCDNRKDIVVIGGGFAGLNFTQKIDKKRFRVTLVDKNNYHSFPPLFYQVASGGLDPASISFPFRRELRKQRQRGVTYRMSNVTKIDYDKRKVYSDDGDIHYDILVIAAGSTNNFFGNPELIKRVYTLKSTPEALRCRDEILTCLERASNSDDPNERKRLLSFAVVGGGPTGVEIAGALGEVKRYVIAREYPRLNPEDMSITVIEGAPRLLGAMSDDSSRRALEYLGKLLVDVKLGKVMKEYTDDDSLLLSDGTSLRAHTVIWTAGVTASSFEEVGKAPERGIGNRIMVDEYNRVPGADGVYALGDIAVHLSEEYPKGCPQLAQPAIQQAKLLAAQLNSGEFKKPFRYRDMGSMATVGRNLAVVEIKGLRFGGWLAWFVWMFIHLISLLGMRNKITVLVNWMWAYFTFNSSLRLMYRKCKYPIEK